ncbi:hypothetical protein HYPSUDRAFT_204610 [Hypholoma sublateritium FD-334 SS-4]|uniref:Uncharacterized protein n=1 Tax=Hypholoma sublateritium (strain FD-334 SS-4) TaxID=945553 RepID=A0A0D2M7Z5_HYPSF|nr:hypothetical protein HYPSUDRAFT_204610 [Hypholoma sublateritium FD-334 SS-4]
MSAIAFAALRRSRRRYLAPRTQAAPASRCAIWTRWSAPERHLAHAHVLPRTSHAPQERLLAARPTPNRSHKATLMSMTYPNAHCLQLSLTHTAPTPVSPRAWMRPARVPMRQRTGTCAPLAITSSAPLPSCAQRSAAPPLFPPPMCVELRFAERHAPRPPAWPLGCLLASVARSAPEMRECLRLASQRSGRHWEIRVLPWFYLRVEHMLLRLYDERRDFGGCEMDGAVCAALTSPTVVLGYTDRPRDGALRFLHVPLANFMCDFTKTGRYYSDRQA